MVIMVSDGNRRICFCETAGQLGRFGDFAEGSINEAWWRLRGRDERGVLDGGFVPKLVDVKGGGFNLGCRLGLGRWRG